MPWINHKALCAFFLWQAAAPQSSTPTPRAQGTDTTLARGCSQTNPDRVFEAAFHSHSHQPSTLTNNSND